MKLNKLYLSFIAVILIVIAVVLSAVFSTKSHKSIAFLSPSPIPTITPVPSNTPTPTQTPTPTVTPTSTPVPSPTFIPHFSTLPPGSVLPSGDQCALRVRRSGFEPRPENNEPNHTIPVAGRDYDIIDWGPNSFGQNERANTLRVRINGNFTGTTDEILQWAACKWGVDEDIVRAQATQESYWRMSQLGDGDQSVGILQVKMSVHRNTDPAARISTAFNADYTYAFWRSCYEGYIDWLHAEHPEYNGGDVWGCLGHWASGGWNNEDANTYINNVKGHLHSRTWADSNF